MANQSPCVVPSNAPALSESSSKALRIGSGNIGSEGNKVVAVVPKSNSRTSRVHPAAFSGSLNDPIEVDLRVREKKRRRQTRNYFTDRNGMRIHSSKVRDPVLTLCELQSPRYLAYRAKQRQQKDNKVEQKWTDELEEVFQQALREIPVVGRMKLQYGEHQLGRNQLISIFIKERTGKDRCRKQVSSHIQVLKAFLVANDTWMSLVTQVDQNVKGDKYGGDDMNRLISNPLVKPESHGDSMVRQSPYFHTLPSCPAPGILGSSTPSRGHSVHRINFEMCILDQDLNKLHVYSSLQSEIGSAARKLDDIPDWYSMYPQLATYYNQGRLDGEIILFETNFDLMDNHPPSKSKLSIDFTIDIARGMEYTNWECHSNFYEKGVLQKSVSTLMNSEYVSSTGDARIVVLLHSKWWVDHFTNIIKQRQEIKDRDFDALQKEDERVCNRIRTISVVQEIWATHQSCRSSSERIAILIWSFRQTRNHKVATTTWRKLILPAIKAKNNTPTQGNRVSSWQPSPVIDTAARDHGLSQNVPVYTQCFNPDSIFAENSETFLAGSGTRLSSPSSTPLANHRSFPSSTSTSFASSISSSTLPLDASQEPNFALHEFIITSQDLAYANPDFDFGSKDLVYTAKDFKNSSESSETHSSQHPAYCTHDGNSVDCQNPAYSSQDYFYNTKAISYESQELKSPYPAPPLSQYQPNGQEFHSMTEAIDDPQELTGIHTRLSFAELEDPPPSYDAPFVVPLVSNMVPQKIRHGDLEQSSTDVQNDIRKSPYLPSSSRSQELLDMEHFQAMDQTVQWTGIRFQNGAFGDAGNMIEHGQTLGEMDGLEKNLDDDLGFR